MMQLPTTQLKTLINNSVINNFKPKTQQPKPKNILAY